MATRLPASQRTREELQALIEGRLSTVSGKDELVKLAARLIVEEALEGETADAIGRDYYEHGAQPGQGYRNGYRTGRLKTAEGLMDYSAPQIAGRDEPFHSAIREHLKGHTQGLEDLAIEMLARGLSVRDIEDAFKDESGRLLLSRTAVSQLGERLWDDYQSFAKRDLSEYEISYLFVDGIAERLRPGARREPVLAAWGYTVEGRRVLLHLVAFSPRAKRCLSCRKAASRKTVALWRAKAAAARAARRVGLTCVVCGKQLVKAQRFSARFCGQACRWKHYYQCRMARQPNDHDVSQGDVRERLADFSGLDLARCQSLPVTMGRALTDASNIIGTVILAFVGHGETWSVVRVYDKSAAAQMVGGWFTTEMVFLASG